MNIYTVVYCKELGLQRAIPCQSGPTDSGAKRDLMANLNTDAELAAVLGHDISHVTVRHAANLYLVEKFH